MKKLFGIIKQAWFLNLLGVLALSTLIWFIGPLFSFAQYTPLDSELSRMITIGSLFALWLLVSLWKMFRAKQKNNQMLEKISAQQPEPALFSTEHATEEEVKKLDTRFQEAMQDLKGLQLSTKTGHPKQYLYQLPWYIIIGPPGSGKTTLLANSNLQFPLSEKYGKAALLGVGGTRDCDWWFTNEAVLLDTAGRYVTQESNQKIDQGAWLGFLDLLKQHREHQPVNGIIIAVSISDLLQSSAEERQRHAKAIRSRIAELYERLNISIPVYMMFTKSDLLAGFSEFFDDLNKEQREQVWGTTFTLNPESSQNTPSNNTNTLGLFSEEFSLLEQRIHQQLLQKLDEEKNLNRRQAMYLFPQQFSSLKTLLDDFLTETFQSSQFHQSIMLRGVYFTSATQEGSPIDRIISTLANNFGIARQQITGFSGKGKSFFINRLLKQVIFAESGLAGTDQKLEKKRQWLQIGIGIAVGIGSLLIAAVWVNSYQTNKTVITEYQQEVNKVEAMLKATPYTGTLTDQLPMLNNVRQLTHSYADDDISPSLSARFGLYQGNALRQQMDDSYQELLRVILRPHAKQNLEQRLSKNMDQPTALFGLLKTYLYLGGEAPEDTPPPALSEIDWDNNGQSNDRNDRLLSMHFNALLKQPPSEPISLNKALIERARAVLSNDPAKLAYVQLKNAALNDSNHLQAAEFRISEKEGLGSISSSFIRKSGQPWLVGIPALYTKVGFSELFLPKYNTIAKNLKKDRWVLGDYQQIYADSSHIKASVRQYYQADYIKNWSDLLRDLSLKSLKSTQQAPEILRPLTADGGNLLTFIMQAVQAETDFSDENNFPIIGNAIELKETLKAVDTHFKPLHTLLKEEQLKQPMQLIDDLYKGLYQDISGGKEVSGKVKTTLSELNAAIDKLPEILRIWLLKPIKEAKQIVGVEVTKGASKELLKKAKEALCKPCETHFKGKYPFSNHEKKSVDIAEFNTFFAVGGTADSFAKMNLQQTTDVQPHITKSLNIFSKEAAKIRRIFFSTGNLNINYSLQLISAAPEVESIQLAIGTIKNTFLPDAERQPKEMYTWPASPITGIVTFKNPEQPAQQITISAADEQWGLFKKVKNHQLFLPHLGNALFAVKTPTLKENPFTLFSKIGNTLKKCRCPSE